MTEKSKSPFVPGADVFIVTKSYTGDNYKPSKIYRVYKNGNLTLIGSRQQYRTRNLTDGWIAVSTARGRISNGKVVMATPDVIEKAKAVNRANTIMNRFSRAVDDLKNARVALVTESHCIALEKIVAELETENMP